jgi:hypothetical protein
MESDFLSAENVSRRASKNIFNIQLVFSTTKNDSPIRSFYRKYGVMTFNNGSINC